MVVGSLGAWAAGASNVSRETMTPLSTNLPWELANSKWAQSINPILAIPMLSGKEIQGVKLVTGVNVFSHKLGRQPQGWYHTDLTAAATIFRSAPFDKDTLTLTSSANCEVSIWIF